MPPHSPHTRARIIHRGGKKVRAHRWLMEQNLGRPLLTTEHVHHKDGNPLNNDLANLEVLDAHDHMVLHKRHPVPARECPNCRVLFTPADDDRKRSYRKCCSGSCAQAVRVRRSLEARGLA